MPHTDAYAFMMLQTDPDCKSEACHDHNYVTAIRSDTQLIGKGLDNKLDALSLPT
jgi:hypothetical protein